MVATLVLGDAVYDLLTEVLGYTDPFPFHRGRLLPVHVPVVGARLLIMARSRPTGTSWAALLDALIVTVGMGLLSWVFLVRPYLADDSLGCLSKMFSVGDPLGDLPLLAMLVRLVAAGDRTTAVRLLTVGTVGLLVADRREGIETQAQRDILVGLGCRYGQGYPMSRSVTAADWRRTHGRLRTGGPARRVMLRPVRPDPGRAGLRWHEIAYTGESDAR